MPKRFLVEFVFISPFAEFQFKAPAWSFTFRPIRCKTNQTKKLHLRNSIENNSGYYSPVQKHASWLSVNNTPIVCCPHLPVSCLKKRTKGNEKLGTKKKTISLSIHLYPLPPAISEQEQNYRLTSGKPVSTVG